MTKLTGFDWVTSIYDWFTQVIAWIFPWLLGWL